MKMVEGKWWPFELKYILVAAGALTRIIHFDLNKNAPLGIWYISNYYIYRMLTLQASIFQFEYGNHDACYTAGHTIKYTYAE